MKFLPIATFILLTSAALAADPVKFVSPDGSASLVVDKSGRRDSMRLRSGDATHPLFAEDLDATFKAKVAQAFNASLNKVGKIVPPTFLSARWLSATEVEVKGESSAVINDNAGDSFTFTALFSKAGLLKELTVTPAGDSTPRKKHS